MHAVGGRAVDVIHALAMPVRSGVERQRIARPAAVSIGRDDGDLRERRERLDQGLETVGTVAIVIADQDSHARMRAELHGPGTPGGWTRTRRNYTGILTRRKATGR